MKILNALVPFVIVLSITAIVSAILGGDISETTLYIAITCLTVSTTFKIWYYTLKS